MQLIDNIISYCSEHSQDMLFGAGCGCLLLTIGTSIKAGADIYVASKEYHQNMADITEAERLRDSGEIDPETPYPPEDAEADRKDAKIAYAKSIARASVLPAVAGTASAACFGMSTGIANAKTAKAVATAEGLALTVNGLSRFIKDYRGRVIDEEGMLKDLHYALGIPEKEITEDVIDEKTGKKKKVKKQVLDIKSEDDLKNIELSPYQLIWGPYKRNGQPNHNYIGNKNLDITFLEAIQNTCECKLQRKGYLIMPDVLTELNEDAQGEVLGLGWIKKFQDEAANRRFGMHRDGHVNFRIQEIGFGSFLLDFNCDGAIGDKINDAVAQNAKEIGGVVFK